MTDEYLTSRGNRRPQSFSRKTLVVTFNVVNERGLTDQLTLDEGHRIRATISHAGMGIGTELSLTIEGMRPDLMNRLSFVANRSNMENPTVTNQSSSTVELRAGTYGKALTLVFTGSIRTSFASFNSGSSVFNVKAQMITLLSDSITDPISYSGSVPVPAILSDICTSAGLAFADHGGWKDCPHLSNHYAGGTALDKIADVVHAAGGTWNLTNFQDRSTAEGQSRTGIVHAWGSAYSGNEVKRTLPLINHQSGMIGYPEYNDTGISLDCLFRPDISFYEPIEVRSSQMPAGWEAQENDKNQQGQYIGSSVWNGYWLPLFISHDLSSEVPNGPWMTHIECQRVVGNIEYAITTR
ncbi:MULTISPECIES: hypothetical protein [unclassified Saccharibacter]|uniref:hypothetical protein n=1 Tax=unclassified Saccharibacter TaxID=2648722 RepID=UPI001352EBFD|nr:MULTISPECIES: hypothetical protein [unclassified Saccharibacter]MXV58358.1 hypothetical protein [Saccharibacter sp. EH70]MXV65802.1 hypothetical protein [Saccharibacter sp. EH60]